MSKRFLGFIRLGLVLILLIAMGVCVFSAEKTIKVGVVVARTGANAVLGKWFDGGAILAVDEINSAGGVLGMQIELIPEDNKGVPVEAVNSFRKVVYEDKVNAIIGCCMSSNTLAAMTVAQEAGIPQLTMSLNPTVTQLGNPYIFRLQPTDGVTMSFLVDFILDNLKEDKIAMIHDADDWGTGAANVVVPRLNERGVPLLVIEKLTGGEKDFSSQLLKVKQSGAKVLILVAHEMESGLVAKQARQLKVDVVIVGSAAIGSPKYIDVAGKEAAEGNIFFIPFMAGDPRPIARDFVKNFEAKWDYTPDHHCAGVYDAVYLLVQAIKDAGTVDGEKVAEALHNIKNLERVSGIYTYDENGEGLTELAVGTIKDGVTVPYTP